MSRKKAIVIAVVSSLVLTLLYSILTESFVFIPMFIALFLPFYYLCIVDQEELLFKKAFVGGMLMFFGIVIQVLILYLLGLLLPKEKFQQIIDILFEPKFFIQLLDWLETFN